MVGKAFLVEPQRKAVMLVCHPRIRVMIGVGAFLLFIGEPVGTAQELPTGTISLSGRADPVLAGVIPPLRRATPRRRQAPVNG